MRERRKRQLLIALGGLGLWSLWPHPEVWSLVVTYLIAWLVVARLHERVSRLPVWAWVVLPLLVTTSAGFAFMRTAQSISEHEDLHGFGHYASSRRALERTPAVFPRVVRLDRPQALWAHAPGASEVRLAIGEATFAGTALGNGLFRIAVEPAGVTLGATSLVVDGARQSTPIELVEPREHPREWCRAPDRSWAAALSEETDAIHLFFVSGDYVRVPVGDGPVSCAVQADSTLVVFHRWAEPHRYSIAPDAVTLRGDDPVDEAADVTEVAFASTTQRVLRLLRGTNTRDIPLDLEEPHRVARSGDAWFVSDRRRPQLVRVRAGRVDGMLEWAGRPIVALVGSPHRLWAAVTAIHAPGGSGVFPNHHLEDTILEIDPTRMQIVARHTTQRGQPHITDGVSPIGLEVRPGGLRIAFAGSDQLGTLNRSGLIVEPAEIEVPHATVQLSDGTELISSAVMGAVLRRPPTGDWERIDLDGELSDVSLARRRGEHTFWEATRAGVSCQSCHALGTTDHQIHDIGQASPVAVRTVVGIAGTPPYLRDASHPELADLLDVNYEVLGGFATGTRREREPGLAAFLTSLTFAAERDFDVERAREGLRAFVKARCVLCHAFPAFTNLGEIPVRSIFPEFAARREADDMLDTPSLLGLAQHPPYLADGRAVEIEQAYDDEEGSNLHGDLDALTSEERSAMLDFLEML